jgi:hypothetical protein
MPAHDDNATYSGGPRTKTSEGRNCDGGDVRPCGALYGDLSTADEVSELVQDDRTDSSRVLRRMSGLLRSNAAAPTSEVRSN